MGTSSGRQSNRVKRSTACGLVVGRASYGASTTAAGPASATGKTLTWSVVHRPARVPRRYPGSTRRKAVYGLHPPSTERSQPGCEFELPYASGRPMPASRSDCSVGPTPRQHPASSPSMTTAGTTLIPRPRARSETAVSFMSKTHTSHESQASRWTSSTNSVHAGHAALNTSTIRLFAIGSSSPFVSYRSTLVGRYAKAAPARTCSQRESRAPRSRSRPTSRPLQSSFATSMKNLESGPYSRVKPYEAGS